MLNININTEVSIVSDLTDSEENGFILSDRHNGSFLSRLLTYQ